MKYLKRVFIMVVIISAFVLASAFSANAASCKLKAQTTATNVNIRSGAGIDTQVLTTLKNKTQLTLINTKIYNNSWYKIKLSDGTKGYISKQYLKIKKNQIFIPASVTGYAGYNGKYRVINTTGNIAKWTSSDENVVKVSSKGVTKYLKEGTASITVSAGKKSSKSIVKVVNADVTLTNAPKELYIHESFTLKASCKKTVSFSSSDKNVATIDNNGLITPVSSGKVEFTASSNSGSDSCLVNIKKRAIILKTAKTTLYSGNRGIITAEGGLSDYKYASSDTAVLTVTNDGLITAVGKGTAKIICTSGDLKKTKKFTVKNGKAVNISNKQGTVHSGMTLFLNSSTKNVKWSCSDTSIATVTNGYVLGLNKGTAIITASTQQGAADCLVTVESPQSVRFVYASENSSFSGKKVTFYAITDTKRNYVKFNITAPDGKTGWITNTSKTTEDGRYIWSGSKTLETTGLYTITAYSKTSSKAKWLTEPSATCTTFVSKATDKKTVSYGERRASSDVIDIISQHEGFVPNVYIDKLADVPTVGYGRVVYAGSTFYNGMTKKEAFAFLIKTVNESGFTSRLNKLLTENKIKFSQQQFDALIDFSYNLGAYAISNNEDLLNILLNSYGNADYERTGFINSFDAVVLKEPKNNSAVIKDIAPGTNITLKGAKSKWYKVELDKGAVGYVLKKYVTRRTTDETTRNLNNVNVKAFAKKYLAYHHAGGVCYKGLLYRRIDEVEMFFYGDYIRDGSYNKTSLSYKCANNSGFYI